ncbi:acyltransferase [Microbacterium sp. CFBP 13617]|nr:acyltransferase [Microbacterium sp. CFBP 13617]
MYLGVGAVVDVHPGARLFVGSGTKIMHYVVIAASIDVSVGELTQIAEFSSVRDSDHGLAVGSPMRDQLVSEPVLIGSDVWIARSVAVLRGVSIGDGAVVGANAVVRSDVPSRGVAVGVPARVVRERS